MLSFIHLSDIHFNRYSDDPYDIDQDLRNMLINDIECHYKEHLNTADGILICGDIAFSGQKREYNTAADFLQKVCNVLSLERSKIYCVPGNHDINQTITKESISVKALQQSLEKACTQVEYDTCLGQTFRNQIDGAALCAPIEQYNEFAAQYGCSFTDNKGRWEQVLTLDEGYELCMVGINSTIVSNEMDHRGDGSEKPMRIGTSQMPGCRRANKVYLSLCHHPPECWFDPECKLRKIMNGRVSVQLYGHKHLQTICREGDTLVIGSGATHPSRNEDGWEPRYNWISLRIEKHMEMPTLMIQVFPRVLNKDMTYFGPDEEQLNGSSYMEFSIKLAEEGSVPLEQVVANSRSFPVQETETIYAASWERRFIYDFINLPQYYRTEILSKLKLNRPEDEGHRHIELLRDYIYRAKEQGCVEQLLKELQQQKERNGIT